ncbi:MAG: ATP-dependent DNA helicase RecQ [Solobacterium sp.]|nr:ATP-dependent DNA helicase RecQ [Solobacterium sp.]
MATYSDAGLNAVFRQIRPDIGDDLRQEQLQIIHSLLSGRDTISILPTGGGKSACFQIAGLLMPGITLVISPLAALIRDQAETLYRNGIPAACLCRSLLVDRDGLHEGSEVTARRRDSLFREIIQRQNTPEEYKLLYITPERLCTPAFLRFAERADISLIAVDEAHCISLWGYEFRRKYLEIPRFLKLTGKRPVIAAFTATATREVCEDIAFFLDLKRSAYCPSGHGTLQNREELRFRVIRVKNNAARSAEILRYVREHKEERGIIYCSKVRQVNYIWKVLKQDPDLRPARYYAGLDTDPGREQEESRSAAWEDFISGRKNIIVATNALGMGVDIPDVRYVLHAEMPLNPEHYYQEAGRAGRKSTLPAECILYWVPEDRETCEELIEQSLRSSGLEGMMYSLRRQTLEERLNVMEEYCRTFADRSAADQSWLTGYFNHWHPDTDNSQEVKQTFRRELSEIRALYLINCLPANELRKGHTEGRLRVSSRKQAFARTVLYRCSTALSYFDMMVFDAVCTLIAHRVKRIHARSIAALLSGTPSITLRPERTETINASLRRMMNTRFFLDFRSAAGMYFRYSDESDGLLEGSFLPLQETGNGFTYDIHHLPPLWEYALITGQILTVPLRILHYVPTDHPPMYTDHSALGAKLRKGLIKGDNLTVNKRKPGMTVSYSISQSLDDNDLLYADAVYTLIRNGQRTFSSGQILELLYENFRLIKDRRPSRSRPEESLRREQTAALYRSLEKLSCTYITITLKDNGTESVFEGVFLPLERQPGKYTCTDDRLPFYACCEQLDRSLYRYTPKNGRTEGHTSFANLALVHALIHAVRISPSSPADRRYGSRTASMVALSSLQRVLSSVPGTDGIPADRILQSGMRILHHMKEQRALRTYGLIRNHRSRESCTIEFQRYSYDPFEDTE